MTMGELARIIGVALALVAPVFADGQGTHATGTAAEPASSAHLDYGDLHNWLCFPGKSLDACDVDLSTTLVGTNGHIRIEKFRRAADPAIDCFYVYPTVSKDRGANAEPVIETEEREAVRTQFARFGARCRLFAPVYRQHTLTALLAELAGHPIPGAEQARRTAYEDVKDAWGYYLSHENRGRGVVLIGHSQGAAILIALLRHEVDGKAAQAVLVSALLMGVDLAIPKDGDAGGDLKSIPLCRQPQQTGCVIAYSSFRANAPPPPNSIFGRPRNQQAGMRSACANPADLAGGSGSLKSYFQSGTWHISDLTIEPPRWTSVASVTTPFVAVPGLLTAQCVATDEFNYLAVTVNPEAAGARTNEITGDVIASGSLRPEWGLHLIDVDLAMGNLLDIVAAESGAWATRTAVRAR
jgi:hypothetical protein